MSTRRTTIITLAVAVAGAVWGTACVVVTTAIVVGQEGMYLPWFLAVGPLLLVSEHLPVAVTGFVLVPALYASITAALWRAGRSRPAAFAATALYALLFTGPVIGRIWPYWSYPPRDMNFWWEDLSETYIAARDLPWWFTAMFLGFVSWHAFAWWRLARFWSSGRRPAAVRWLFAGAATGLFGATLAWGAMTLLEGPSCGALPGLLVLGPIVFLEELPVGVSKYLVLAASAAMIYGLTGILLAAARERPSALWPAVVAWSIFTVGSMIVLGWWEAKRPGGLLEECRGVGTAVRSAPPLFLAVTTGFAGWQTFVVSSLWRAFHRGRDRQGAPIES